MKYLKHCLYCNSEMYVIESQKEIKKYCCKDCFNKSKKGIKQTEETKEKLKGRIPWNKGIKINIIPWNKGLKYSEEQKEKLNIDGLKLGHAWNKGTKGLCKSNSGSFKKGTTIRKGTKHSIETIKKIGDGNRGKIISQKTKNKLSEYNITNNVKPPTYKMEKHWNWNGGISFENYPKEWNKMLKEHIRNRDNYTCSICNKKEIEEKRKMHVHHIDYDKNNCDYDNLITLCNSCHIKTNTNRLYWKAYFNNLKIKSCQ